MEHITIFPTVIWKGESELDNHRLRDKCYDFQKDNEGQTISNVGGYQGDGFYDEKFAEFVIESVPRLQGETNKYLPPMEVYSWVNINGVGHYNEPHSHYNQMTQTFLSCVYYVSVPEKSGVIRFFDPRGSMVKGSLDQDYYFNAAPFQYLQPEDGMILLFPSWLEHDVTGNYNPDEEDRISIGFNIVFPPQTEENLER